MLFVFFAVYVALTSRFAPLREAIHVRPWNLAMMSQASCGRFGVVDQFQVFVVDHAFVGQVLEVDDRVPIFAAVEDDGDLLHAARLAEAERVEQLVERAEAAGEDDERGGAQDEVELAHREVVELEAEIGRDVRVGLLLVRQIDVEADALGAGFERAAVGGFHDAGAAAGHDDELRAAVGLLRGRNDAAELAGFVVEVALGHDPLGPLECASDFRIVGRFLGVELGFAENGFGLLAGHDLRAAEDDDRGIDVMLAEQRFGFEQLELHPQRAVFLALEEVDIDFGELVAGRLEDREPVGGDLVGDRRSLQRFGTRLGSSARRSASANFGSTPGPILRVGSLTCVLWPTSSAGRRFGLGRSCASTSNPILCDSADGSIANPMKMKARAKTSFDQRVLDGDAAAAIVAAAPQQKPPHDGNVVVPADRVVALRAARAGEHKAFAGAEAVPDDGEKTADGSRRGSRTKGWRATR